MTKRTLRLLAIVLALSIALSGCSGLTQLLLDTVQQTQPSDSETSLSFSQMEYTRPDLDEHDRILENACQVIGETTDIDQALDQVYTYYDAYDRFYTNYALADIHYSADLTDTYWQTEYEYCAAYEYDVSTGLDLLYASLAKSPILDQLESEDCFGAGFFDGYQEYTQPDETMTALMAQEVELQNRYYELSQAAMDMDWYSQEFYDSYGLEMEQLLVELVALRQQIAKHAGYDSYPQFAYDAYHYRDYTPDQVIPYLEQVGQALAPLYRQMAYSPIWEESLNYCTQQQTYAYVSQAAQSMGGTVAEAFTEMESRELFDIGYGTNKFDSSFEIYLWSYAAPYVFMNPYKDQTDKLTFAHEFGHFCNDYVCQGSYAGTDVLEVHSQGMEYMSILYGSDPAMKQYKLLDSLFNYTEQSAYALFEHRLYQLEGNDLTVENVRALFDETAYAFGFDGWGYDSREYLAIPHFYTDPLYVMSYVVSNDVAMQLYQLELESPGSGLEIYEAILESHDCYIIAFAESYGLESPFAPGRLEDVKKTLQEGLQ